MRISKQDLTNAIPASRSSAPNEWRSRQRTHIRTDTTNQEIGKKTMARMTSALRVTVGAPDAEVPPMVAEKCLRPQHRLRVLQTQVEDF